MPQLDEAAISRAIVDAYHRDLADRIVSDVLIAGAGPSGMTAAHDLARRGLKVTVLEKRLAAGGGIWGGAMGMCQAVVQDTVLSLLDELDIRHAPHVEGLHTVHAAELASALCARALQAGAALFNLLTVEDLCVRDGRVVGLVANRSPIGEALPVDPITFSARAVVDTTGHEAVGVRALGRRGLLTRSTHANWPGEGPMNAQAGEAFVVEHVSEIYPGLWIAGMTVCATLGGPRMGPIFGGMLLSGRRVAQRIVDSLANPQRARS